MNNYEVSRDRAQAYFLGFDQKKLIDFWNLAHDEAWLYTDFLGKPYRICRETGSVFRCTDNAQADFSEVLSIFDLLCHEGSEKFLSGKFAPVNSLKNRPRTIGVGGIFESKAASVFDRDPGAFQRACLSLGGTPVPMGDMGFSFPVFQDMNVILKFYRADEDFPASITLLWDEETLRYLYYETVFYIAGFLTEQIRKEMNRGLSH